MNADKQWIQTFTGRKFWPASPVVADICIEDIARALSMTCRYNGHVSRFYSVAEHSVRVSRLVWDRCCVALRPASCVRYALWGLLHDASEAYITDITRPVKRLPELAGYREIESRLQIAVCLRFGLPPREPEVVTDMDHEILGTEARQLKSPVHPDWAATTPTGQLPAPIPGMVLGWSPRRAEYFFRSEFDRLTHYPTRLAEEA